jgi:hypothetical protein
VAGPVPSNPDPACARTISQGGKAADEVHTVISWFNPCAFGIPQGAFGTLGRNVFRGKSVFNTDLSLFKSFPIREGMSLQLRAEAFNVFNVQNWNVPNPTGNNNIAVNTNQTTIVGSSGRITDLAPGTTPRQIQFGIRFMF